MSKLLQIVLVGQPELRKTLALPELRQLRQRISISCHLQPLNREETEKYIYHRLEKAGDRKSIRFQDGTIDRIHDFSKGVPRLVNIICDYLLLTAFSSGTKEISEDIAREVAGELERENRYWQDSAADEIETPGSTDEVSERPDRAEKCVQNSAVSPDEIASIAAGVASIEEALARQVKQLRSQLWEMEVKIRTLATDFKEMKRTVSRWDPPQETSVEIYRKGDQ